MPKFCQYCFARLSNGSAFCDEACEDGAWQICPTIDGEIYEPPEPAEPRPAQLEFGVKPTRPALERPPLPQEAASAADRDYISGERLRQRLLEANP